jgi:hypothetical protein
MNRSTARILSKLAESGLLLLQDKRLLNVVSLTTGETVRGSWWAHSKSHEIFRTLTELADHPDVLFCKLVAGKVTLVHRRLWPALLAVAISREPWQTRGLSSGARALLNRVGREGRVAASGTPIKDLERRLLVSARQEHTAAGAHLIVAESWELWARRAGVTNELSAAQGKRRIEKAASAIGAGPTQLPWSSAETSGG